MANTVLNIRAFIYIVVELVIFLPGFLLADNCTEDESEGIHWTVTEVGKSNTQPCHSGVGELKRNCSSSAEWGKVDSTSCSSKDLITLRTEFANPNQTWADFVGELAVSSSKGFNTSGELLNVVTLVEDLMVSDPLIVSDVNASVRIMEDILAVVNNTLDSSLLSRWDNIHEFYHSSACLDYIENVQQFGRDVLSFLSEANRTSLSYNFEHLEAEYQLKSYQSLDNFSISLSNAKVTVPRLAFKKYDGNGKFGVAVLQFAQPVKNLLPSSSVLSTINYAPASISSAFLSVTQFPMQLLEVLQNSAIQLVLNTSLSNLTSCGLMNFSSTERLWEDKVCTVEQVRNGEVFCSCKELSVYAVIDKVPRRLHPVVLAILIMTELLLWATILMLLYANRKLESDRAIVVKLFLLTMSATHITLMAGLYSVHNEDACTAVALMLHFFELSEAFWLLGMVVQLVLKVTYKTTDSGSVSQYMALGWITPLFVVASTAGLEIEQYGTDYYCFLNIQNEIFYAFAVPATLIVATSFVCLVYIAYAYCMIRKKNRKAHRRLIVVLPNIRASMVACVTLVLDWIATTLSLSIVNAWTMSFFALLKIVEAVCIFFLFGVLSSEVRHEYEKRYGRCWPNRRKKGDSQRPGTNDELSQIRESSVIHDLDSTISTTGALNAFSRAPSSNSNGGYNFSNSTTSLRKADFNANSNGSNPFITRGFDSNGGVSVVNTANIPLGEGTAGTSGTKEDVYRKESALSESAMSSFKGLSLKHKLKVFPLLKHEEEQEESSIT